MDENKTAALNRALAGIWDSLTDEQKAKAKECKSMDELAALAGAAGVELPDEMLDAVAGGDSWCTWDLPYCPLCGRKHMTSKLGSETITPAGESTPIKVFAYNCSSKGKYYISSLLEKYYDANGNVIGSSSWQNKSCV